MHWQFFMSRLRPKPTLIKLCLIWALIMQSAFTPALRGSGNAASYFCAQGVSAPSPQGRAALTTLLRAAGQDISQIPADNRAHEHCEKCLSGLSAVLSSANAARANFAKPRPSAAPAKQYEFSNLIRGPPLGCRAPPAFV